MAAAIIALLPSQDIKDYGLNFDLLKTIETRQKPGDISPAYTTTYKVTYYRTVSSTSPLKTETLTDAGMSPYSVDSIS